MSAKGTIGLCLVWGGSDSLLTTRCQSSQGLGLSFVLKEFRCVSSFCPLPFYIIRTPTRPRSYSSVSLLQALPIPALADRPPFFCTRRNMELFHPVRSCTHLFSMSKTQGLCGVMIGFLLCNLLEFSLSHQQESTVFSFTHTHC